MAVDPYRAAEVNHEFTIGAFDCAVVSDGSFAYPNPRRLFFANAGEEELGMVLERYGLDPENWETYVSPYPCLLIQTGDDTILVDTGGGDLGDHTGKLVSNLEQVGLTPEAIDTVLSTHIHPDHVGGNLDENDEPAFPNAEYIVSRSEAEFWLNDPDLSQLRVPEFVKEAMLTTVEQQIRPLGDHLTRIEDETELVPGVRTIPTPGHTPGHVAVEVSSNGETFLYLVDLVFHPVHVERPEWYTAFDLDPERVVDSRNRMLERAAVDSTLVMAQHLPAPGLGHITSTESGYEWTPIDGSDPQ